MKRRKAIGFAVAVGVVVSGVFVRRDIVSAAALNARGSELPLEMVRFVVAALRFGIAVLAGAAIAAAVVGFQVAVLAPVATAGFALTAIAVAFA